MSIQDELIKEIGNVDSDNLLFHALACLILYKLRDKEEVEKEEDDGDYNINSAFEDTFKRRSPTKKLYTLIPSPS